VLIAFHDVIGNDESARRGWHFTRCPLTYHHVVGNADAMP
jgi:hypothetical protein